MSHSAAAAVMDSEIGRTRTTIRPFPFCTFCRGIPCVKSITGHEFCDSCLLAILNNEYETKKKMAADFGTRFNVKCTPFCIHCGLVPVGLLVRSIYDEIDGRIRKIDFDEDCIDEILIDYIKRTCTCQRCTLEWNEGNDFENKPEATAGRAEGEVVDRDAPLAINDQLPQLAELAMTINLRVAYLMRHGVALEFKIDDLERKIQDATSGRTSHIVSPTFNTNRTGLGYQMRAHIYLNGGGMGRGTHLSVYICLVRGQDDAMLQWPFRKRITIILLDQINGLNSFVDAIPSDALLSNPRYKKAFARPTSEMNLRIGFPLYLPLIQLDRYIKDDAITIKISINHRSIHQVAE